MTPGSSSSSCWPPWPGKTIASLHQIRGSIRLPPLSSSHGAGQTGQRDFAKFHNAQKSLLNGTLSTRQRSKMGCAFSRHVNFREVPSTALLLLLLLLLWWCCCWPQHSTLPQQQRWAGEWWWWCQPNVQGADYNHFGNNVLYPQPVDI